VQTTTDHTTPALAETPAAGPGHASAPRLLRAAGLSFVGINVAFLVLVFSIGSPPPNLDDPKLVAYLHDHAALLTTVTLLSYLSLIPFAVFVAAVRSMIRDTSAPRWVADGAAALGAAFVAIAFVDFGMMGAAQASAMGQGDPATVRTLEELGRYVGTVPSALEWGLLMAAVSLAIAMTGLLPRWVAWVGWMGAAAILVTTASLYVGDTNSFWAADGGIGLLDTLALLVWMTCLSVAAGRAAFPGHSQGTST